MRDYADKAIREALLDPDNLRDLLRARVPELADGFDCTRAKVVKPEFLLPDGRGREADLLFEIPYRTGDNEQIALVCVLIEHQTQSDPRMALRTLLYVVLYWERQWAVWEGLPAPKPTFRLTPVLPLVLHTGSRPWGSAKSIAELLDWPDEFRQFAPVWSPLFWDLPEHSVDELLSAEEAFVRTLAVVRVEDADLPEFERVFRQTWERLEPMQDTNRIRWSHLLHFIIGWFVHRRPENQQPELRQMAEQLVNETAKRGSERPFRTIADAMREDFCREFILKQGAKRFGAIDPEIASALAALKDYDRLERMTDRLLEATSWSDLLGTP